jgi:GntR family transcriptional regulator
MLGSVTALDPDDPRPAYRQISDRLRADIASGARLPGSQLPSLRELSEAFDVAVETVKRALGDLRSEGLLVTRQGKGTFVRTEVTEVPENADSADVIDLARMRAQLAEHSRRLDEIERRLDRN